ncbi:hypothetical protein FQR65_LT07413 [Abscondita terminalis]|nr:hypothetical protein FQR65_LT07413 [Abscondita terminalis]
MDGDEECSYISISGKWDSCPHKTHNQLRTCDCSNSELGDMSFMMYDYIKEAMKKDSAEESMETKEEEELSYEQKVANACVIAKPMASKKLTKKCYKLLKKASKHKTYVRNGLKDVQKRIRKGEHGLLFFAADVSPIDIMVHLPGVCEDKNIPYCYTPSRADLGAALGVKRGSLLALVREKEDYKELYDELKQELINLAVEL